MVIFQILLLNDKRVISKERNIVHASNPRASLTWTDNTSKVGYDANKQSADQPVHPCSLISAFIVRCLDSIIYVHLSKSKISGLYLVSVADQGVLSLTWWQTPKTGFLMTWLIWFLIFFFQFGF